MSRRRSLCGWRMQAADDSGDGNRETSEPAEGEAWVIRASPREQAETAEAETSGEGAAAKAASTGDEVHVCTSTCGLCGSNSPRPTGSDSLAHLRSRRGHSPHGEAIGRGHHAVPSEETGQGAGAGAGEGSVRVGGDRQGASGRQEREAIDARQVEATEKGDAAGGHEWPVVAGAASSGGGGGGGGARATDRRDELQGEGRQGAAAAAATSDATTSVGEGAAASVAGVDASGLSAGRDGRLDGAHTEHARCMSGEVVTRRDGA
eukprot:ctg_714.g299